MRWTATTSYGPFAGPAGSFANALFLAAAALIAAAYGVPTDAILSIVSVVGSVAIVSFAVLNRAWAYRNRTRLIRTTLLWGLITIWPIVVVDNGFSVWNVTFLTVANLVIWLLLPPKRRSWPAPAGSARVHARKDRTCHEHVTHQVTIGVEKAGYDGNGFAGADRWQFSVAWKTTSPDGVPTGTQKAFLPPDATADDLVALIEEKVRPDKSVG